MGSFSERARRSDERDDALYGRDAFAGRWRNATVALRIYLTCGQMARPRLVHQREAWAMQICSRRRKVVLQFLAINLPCSA